MVGSEILHQNFYLSNSITVLRGEGKNSSPFLSLFYPLTLLHSEWPKLHRVLAVRSVIGLKCTPQKDVKIYLCGISKNISSKLHIILRMFKDFRANSGGSDRAAHDEPPHLNIRCLQFQLFFVFIFGTLC